MIPTGYSFNLDGTSIYLTMAAVFIAQATNTPMTLLDQLTLLAVLLLTSKGAAGVTGSGFIVLAATLSAVGTLPVTARSPHPWHRPLHVRGARADEPGRQRRRDASWSRSGAERWTSSACSKSSGNNVADARVRAQ